MRMGLTLLIIIYIFEGVKIITACSAIYASGQLKLLAKRCDTVILTSSTQNIAHLFSMKQLQKMDLIPQKWNIV